MALLGAFLPAESAEAIYRIIDTIARSLKTKDETRTMDALRADALTDLCLGVPSNVRTKIELRVDATTLMGLDDNPAILSGYGPMTAQRAHELAGDENSEWYRILTDSVSGVVIDHGRTRYRPTQALRDLVNARDQRCCGPACNRPAATCEFDHTTPFRDPEGKTAYDSTGPACKFHNDIKEHGWTVTQPTPGRFLWTSPTGRTYDVTPNDEKPTTTVLTAGTTPGEPGLTTASENRCASGSKSSPARRQKLATTAAGRLLHKWDNNLPHRQNALPPTTLRHVSNVP